MMRTLFLLIFLLSVLASPGEIITFYDKNGAYFQCEAPPGAPSIFFVPAIRKILLGSNGGRVHFTNDDYTYILEILILSKVD